MALNTILDGVRARTERFRIRAECVRERTDRLRNHDETIRERASALGKQAMQIRTSVDPGRTNPEADRVRTNAEQRFVCPLCGMTFRSAQQTCSQCEGTLVVSVEDSDVYETVLPMCRSGCPSTGQDPSTEARP